MRTVDKKIFCATLFGFLVIGIYNFAFWKYAGHLAITHPHGMYSAIQDGKGNRFYEDCRETFGPHALCDQITTDMARDIYYQQFNIIRYPLNGLLIVALIAANLVIYEWHKDGVQNHRRSSPPPIR